MKANAENSIVTKLAAMLLATLSLAGMLGAHAAAAATTAIRVTVDRPGIHISPKLWGIFFEEINYAGQGGLYAEMVKNGTFKWVANQNHPVGWQLLVTPKVGNANLWVDFNHPLNRENVVAGRIDVRWGSRPGGVQLINRGYWGMSLKRGASYRLSFFARRSPGMSSNVIVRLENSKASAVLASATVRGISEKWKQFHVRLRANASAPHGLLAFVPTGHGALYLNVVNLFPTDTFDHQRNGLRQDLVKMLVRLHPSFVRFPGGNYIEGNVLAQGFYWNKTIGPLARRPGHWNPWGYWVTDGFGYLEMLELCEELHAQPLYGFNCGFSLGANDLVPTDKLGPWVRSIGDALKFANAPASTKWGALRAKYGHPKPFGMRMLEVGNEGFWQLTNLYPHYYQVFYDRLHAEFPEVKLIFAGAADRTPHYAPIVDEHFYESPQWFWSRRNLYTRQSRNGPKVFVGEYADVHHCGTGNLRGALAEAAWMTGMEKNSDLVVMASYAPLFVNRNSGQWNPDLINFTSNHVWGIVSYWVQDMFSNNRPTRMLPLKLSNRPGTPRQLAAAAIPARFTAIAGVNDHTHTIIIKVVNGTRHAVPVNFSLASAGALLPQGKAIVLTGPHFSSSNSKSDPLAVAPKTSTFAVKGPHFQFVFAARSFTVLRIGEK